MAIKNTVKLLHAPPPMVEHAAFLFPVDCGKRTTNILFLI